MGYVGGENRTAYCASKHAIEGLTKTMAIDLPACGIRVNTLCPTFIRTPMAEAFLANPEFHQKNVSRIFLGRVGEVEDLMGAIVFLASVPSTPCALPGRFTCCMPSRRNPGAASPRRRRN